MGMMCEKDCWNCKYDGCINLTTEDLKRQNEFDREEKLSRNIDINQTDRRYNHSKKARDCKKRYLQTENGKQRNRINTRNWQKKHPEELKKYRQIYYKCNKEKILEKNRKWNEEHREEIRERERKPNARSQWSKRFEKNNGRLPNEQELLEWDIQYEYKRTKRLNKVSTSLNKTLVTA